jgi:hypothetical protein
MPGVRHRPEAAPDPTDQLAQPEPVHLSHEDVGAIAAAVAPAVAQAVTERVLEGLASSLSPATNGLQTRPFRRRVSDGTRTRDRLDHNQRPCVGKSARKPT